MRERMGSGGPRGLQILRSDADRIRGGFDSHAFPPFLRAAVVAALAGLALAGPAAGQGAPPDSTARILAAPPDTVLKRVAAPPDTVVRRASAPPDTASRRAIAPRPWTEQPRFVMLRSLLVPGWGQLHNRAWLKAIGVAGTEVWLISAVLQDKRDLDGLLAEVDAARLAQDEARYAAAATRYNDRLDTYVGRQWLLGGVLAYALVDAYVDAHFRDFDIEFKHDPALPDDLPAEPTTPKGGGAARGGRTSLALRWHF